jgi:hypothetical protein
VTRYRRLPLLLVPLSDCGPISFSDRTGRSPEDQGSLLPRLKRLKAGASCSDAGDSSRRQQTVESVRPRKYPTVQRNKYAQLHLQYLRHSVLDDAVVDLVKEFGGISAIAVSHPHFYASMVEWSHVFDAPIYLHAADKNWVMRSDPAIEFWDGSTKALQNGMTLIRCGGHFDGGTVLHWPEGAEGKGAILSGDILQVVEDRRWVSFMYSYPNFIPLPASKVEQIVKAVEPFDFDRIYGAWWGKIVLSDAKNAVLLSAERYVRAISDPD